MDLDLQDRVFIITDAEPGLGDVVASELETEGARVVRSTSSNRAETDGLTLVARAEAEWGRLDGGLVFVPASEAGSVHDVRDDEWARGFETTFLHVVDTLRQISRALPAGGSLVVVFESAIHEPAPERSMIGDAFGRGLATVVLQMAEELGPRGIRTNAILMGPLAGNREQPGRHAEPTHATRWHTEAIPLRRYGTHQEFARVAAFVLSPAASYISGTLLPVDGGWGRHG